MPIKQCYYIPAGGRADNDGGTMRRDPFLQVVIFLEFCGNILGGCSRGTDVVII